MTFKNKYTACLVFQDEESEKNFRKVLDQKDLREHPLVKFVTTSNDKFLEGNYQDTYDFTCLVFLNEFDDEELELKNELITYYGHVPVTYYFMCQEMQDKSEDEIKPILSYIQTNLEKYLVQKEPKFIDFKNAVEAAQSLAESMEKMIEKYDEKYEQDVKPAFSKFDKDSSGAIDKGELQQLSADLGHPLDEDQLEKALNDLDLNRDGVIDLEEFCRWYFTGLKSYNDTTRNMLVLTKTGLSLGKAISSSEVYNIVMQNRETSHLKGTVKLNEPKADGISAKVEAHFLGPLHERLVKDLDAFLASLNANFNEDDSRTQCFIEVNIKMCDDVSEVQAIWKKIEEGPLAEIKEKLKDAEYNKLEASLNGNIVCLKFFTMVPNVARIQLPEELQNGLRDVDQSIRYQLALGLNGTQLLNDRETPLIQQIIEGGFQYGVQITWLRKLKEALQVVFPPDQYDPISQALPMIGPLLQIKVDTESKVTFDDMESLKAHPMAGNLLLTLPQLVGMVSGQDFDEIKDYNPDFSRYETEEFKKKINEQYYIGNQYKEITQVQLLFDFLKSMSKNASVSVNICLKGIGAVEVQVAGENLGELLSFGVKAASFQEFKYKIEQLDSEL